MDKPATLRVTDGGVLRSALGAAGVGMALLAVVLVVVLVTTEASVTDLMLPAGALSTFWVAWLAVGLLRSAMIRRADRRGIGRLFDGESWARMQFDADEWRTVAEERYREQRGDTAFGIAFAGAIGLVLGAIATLVGWLATDDRAVSITLTLAGVAVVALFVTVASFQPWSQRRTLDRERATALAVLAPRLWFGPGGVYHEADGFTSFDTLVSVTDRTKSAGALVFTVEISFATSGPTTGHTSTAEVPVDIEIPSAHRTEAAALARRYREQLER